MKDKYKQNSQINSAIKNAEIFGDGNVTVGAPITVGNNVIIPVTKLTAVCLGGGGEYGKVNIFTKNTALPFLGGSGSIVNASPVGFLILSNGKFDFVKSNVDGFELLTEKTFDIINSLRGENTNE